MNTTVYPVRVKASLDSQLNRWLWLVKWLLAIPHYVVLAFLWLAFVVLSVAAFVAILLTGRYPRGIFDFNVGVLRWSWRVAYYTYGALGTDRYPPFTLNEVPDYPAHLEVEYPRDLSRGLVLIKWWLLAIPHYLVVGIFAGGGLYLANEAASEVQPWWWGGGLIGVLVLIAAVVLLFTGTYPRSIFDLVLGLNRWVLRVAAYAALMTDTYPPFRLDMGPDEPLAGHVAVTQRPSEDPASTTDPADIAGQPSAATPRPWTAGRVTLMVLGSLILIASLGVGATGGAVAVADRTLRDADGFFMTTTEALESPGYAITSEAVQVDFGGMESVLPNRLLGDAKLTVTPGASEDVFIGIGATSDVREYLAGVQRSVLVDFRTDDARGRVAQYRRTGTAAPPTTPEDLDIWVASASGTEQQSVVWPVESGSWSAVVMNTDASRTVTADVSAGATFPAAGRVAATLLVVAAGMLLIAVALIYAALRSGRPVSTSEGMQS